MAVGNQVGTVSIKVTPDTSAFRRELEAKLKAIENSVEGHIPVKLDLDTNGVRAKVKAATAGLDKDVHVNIDVDQNRFQRLVGKIGTSLADAFTNVPGGRGGGLGVFSSFVDNLAVAAAVASIAAPALALVSGALVSLPGVLAAVASPIAAVVLGMDGIKNAAKGLSEPLAGLKTSISGVFETRLTPVFDKLAGVLPGLSAPLQRVAGGLSDVASSVIDVITSGPGFAKIQDTITNVADTISRSAPGIGKLTDGLLGLAEGVTAKFPGVSQWIDDVGKSFDNWVTKVTESGQLDTAMSNFGTILKGVADIFGDLAKQGFDFLADPKFADSMKTFVDDTRKLVNEVLPGLKQFFMDLTGAIDGVVNAIDKIQSVTDKLPDWVKNEKPGEKTPGRNPFTSPEAPWRNEKFGGMPLFEGFKPENLWGTPQQTWFKTKIKEAFDPSNLFGGMDLTPLFEKFKAGFSFSNLFGTLDLTPLTEKLKAAFNPANLFGGGFDFSTLFAGIGNKAAEVVNQVRTTFSQIPGVVAGALAGVAGVVAGAFGAAVSAVASAGAQMVSAIVSAGGQIVGEVASWAGRVAGAAASLAGSLVGVGGQMVQGFINGFTGAAAHALAVVTEWAGKIAAAAKSALGIHSPSKVFNEIGANTALGLQNGLEGGFQGVIERAKALSQQLTDAVNGGLVGVDAKSLIDGIKRQMDELELQRKQLKVDKDAIPKEDKEKRTGVQGQIDQIQAIKDQLALQKDQLGVSQEYGDQLDSQKGTLGDNSSLITDSITSMIDGIKGFAMANVNQFQSDLGISGEGAIPKVANIGLDWATSALGKLISSPFQQQGGTNITVNSVDDALAMKQTIDNKKALQFAGR